MSKRGVIAAAAVIGLLLCGITGIPVMIAVLWAFLALIPAAIADNKGRIFVPWYIYAWLVWPVALIHSLLIKENDAAMLNSGEYKKCPQCAELIKKEALVCRYCQYHFTE